MRNYGDKKTQSKTKQVRQENKTYTFFDNTDALMEEYQELHTFITQGIKAEGRDQATALPNFLSFLLVLHTSGKQVDQDTLMDAWEVSIANEKVPSDELSRYAWGVMKKMTEGKVA